MREGRKPFTSEDKRAAIELWKAKIPLKAIREQLQIGERSLRRKQEIIKLWVTRMEDCQYLRDLVTSLPRRLQEVIDRGGDITHY